MSAMTLCLACDTYQKAREPERCEKCGSERLWREIDPKDGDDED